MDGDSQTADVTTEPVSMLVEGTVVTMDPERRVIPNGAVAVAGDRIAEVGASADLRARHPEARRLGGTRRYVIPGLIDCHNHIAQALCRESTVEYRDDPAALADDLAYTEEFFKKWFERGEGRLLTIDEEALLGEAEALGARMIAEMAPRRYVQLGTNVDYL